MNNIDMVPTKYRDNENITGAIINYVFQGENTTKDNNITKIGKQILKKAGRYDANSKKSKPFINE